MITAADSLVLWQVKFALFGKLTCCTPQAAGEPSWLSSAATLIAYYLVIGVLDVEQSTPSEGAQQTDSGSTQSTSIDTCLHFAPGSPPFSPEALSIFEYFLEPVFFGDTPLNEAARSILEDPSCKGREMLARLHEKQNNNTTQQIGERTYRLLQRFLPSEIAPLLFLLPYDFEAKVLEERDSFLRQIKVSEASARQIREELEAERKTLQETNSLLAEELMARGRIELELSVHRNSLEKLIQQQTEALVESQKQLLEKERLASLGEFAAGIAHEINNPIGAIILTVNNAKEQLRTCRSREEVEAYSNKAFEKIATQGERCGRIVKGVLQFARAHTTEKWPEDLNRIVTRALKNIRESMPSQAAAIEFRAYQSLPLIPLNPTAMEQVVVNLVKNAVESKRGEVVKVVVKTTLGEGGVLLVVQDFGSGMSKEQQLHLFDPFYTTRGDSGGVGLGLSIVHGIISEHKASLKVSSSPGVGTTMTVKFPLYLAITKPW